ncbi:hypothetical protein [Streptomyces sp. VRA16 Mangrove soil]|nr:hypothetical protein [Streptomyces sp. VRA16 Mangrove soil]MBO1332114.1 hypothetical protein [Streptomyces sp. VRA16 Mangrove soil]
MCVERDDARELLRRVVHSHGAQELDARVPRLLDAVLDEVDRHADIA